MTIVIPKHAYLPIIAASVRFANQTIPQEQWLEVSGIFIGKTKGKKVIISESYPIMHQVYDKNAVIDQYVWSEEDYLSLSIIDDEAFSRGEFTVGWWHSHPGFKIMMSHLDNQTTLSYQINNPLAFCLVFNPYRLIKQVEVPNKKGDPEIKIENDPGFKIYRLDTIDKGIHANYHEVDYEIEGFKNIIECVNYARTFAREATTFFPINNLSEKYNKFIEDSITQLNYKIQGTEEYIKTLTVKGEKSRIPEVLKNQTKDINEFVGNTYLKVEQIREYMNYLEYKERDIIIPEITDILAKWDAVSSEVEPKLKQLTKKY